MKETWKPVVGYEGCYEVSNLGRIKSLQRFVNCGRSGAILNERIIKQHKDKFGYIYVGLSKNGKQKKIKLHRIICMAFIPNPDNKPQVNHRNGVKDDNRLENLEWATRFENMRHAHSNGLVKVRRGESVTNSKLKRWQVHLIRDFIKDETMSQADIARIFNVSPVTINDIKSKRRWGHLKEIN